MRLLSAVAAGAVLVGGCRTATYQRATGPVPIAQGSAAEFSALVPRSPGAAHCEVREGEAGGDGARVIALVHEEPADQRISVMVDAEGVPIRYLDIRGDPSTFDDGDRTTIGLYLTEGYAIAGNRPSGQRAEILEISLEEATVSESLGNPGEMLELVLTQCGRGA